VNIHNEYKEFLRLLIDEKVDFLLIGGFAVAHYGFIRNTQDIDFFFRNEEPHRRRVRKVLENFGIESHLIDDEIIATPGKVLRIGVAPIRIELLNRISGVTFEEAWKTRSELLVDDLKVPVIGRAELLKNKKASGRTKDLLDVEELGSEDQ